MVQERKTSFAFDTSSYRSQRADTALLVANLLAVLFGIGAVASLTSISFGCSSLIAVIFFLVFVGLAGDAYLEARYLMTSGSEDPAKSGGDDNSSLLMKMFSEMPDSFKFNFATEVLILLLTLGAIRYGDVSPSQRLVMVLLIFFGGLMSIFTIYGIRRLKK